MMGKVTYLNGVAEEMTGWSKDEAFGKPLAEVFRIIDWVTRERSPDPMELAVAKNKTVGLTANCILVRRDGIESAIEDSAAPIHDRSGAFTGAVIVFRDVTTSRAMAGEMMHDGAARYAYRSSQPHIIEGPTSARHCDCLPQRNACGGDVSGSGQLQAHK
jgi:PAS domain S-box-containing protein